MRGKLSQYKTALITGATKGIGREFAFQLGMLGKNLILISRKEKELQKLAQELSEKYKIKVYIFVCNLADDTQVTKLLSNIGRELPFPDILINNAGASIYGLFNELDCHSQEQIIKLNIEALIKLTHKVLQEMIRHKHGAILNVSSTAGFMPIPYNAVYCATKAFVTNFSYSLSKEVEKEGIIVSCLCPGPTKSHFWESAGMEERVKNRLNSFQSPVEVAKYGLYLINRRRYMGIPGFSNKIKHIIKYFLPKRLIVNLLYHHMKENH